MSENWNSVNPDEIKRLIVQRFNDKVRGREPDTTGSHVNHDGRGGHWLEVQMGIKLNANNAPDFPGYEMKNDTASRTTFGDWSADYYIFRDPKNGMSRDQFMAIFGQYNAEKKRYSWSGSPIPKINAYNQFGQVLDVDATGNICAVYSYAQDRRTDKSTIVPVAMQREDLVIARWDAEWMRNKVENKFNKAGWFKCKRDCSGVYDKIVFGGPINYSSWLDGVRKGLIYFDSGMFQGNARNYSQWRADNRYWESLVTETY